MMDAEADYQMIFNATRRAMALTELDSGRIVDVNQAWLQATGVDRAMSKNREIPTLGLWVSPLEQAKIMSELRHGGTTPDRDVLMSTSDGVRIYQTSAQIVSISRTTCVLWELCDVTQTRRMQSDLKEAESRFRDLVEQSLFAIQVIRPDGRTSLVNKAWETLWQMPYSSLENYSVLADRQLIAKGITKHMRTALAGETPPPVTFDYVVGSRRDQRRDQGEIVVTVRAFPRKDAAGRVREVVLLQEDVTERVQIERELRSRTAAFISSPAGVIVRHIDGRVIDCNESACYLLGMTREQLFDPSLLDPHWRLIDEAVNDQLPGLAPLDGRGATRGHLLRVEAPEADPRWLSANVEPLIDPKTGRSSGSVAAFVDVTALRELAETRRLAGTVFDFVSEAVMVTNHKNEIVMVNPAFCKVTGYRPEQVIGTTPRILSSGVQTPEFYAAMWQSLRQDDHWSGEIVNRRRDGSLYPEWLTISVVRDANQAITNYVALFSDITERKTNEERLHRLAHFDYLTGLPNRLLLQERLSTAIEDAALAEHRLAVLFIDLDNFKLINDSLGHGIGDKLLIAVAARLSKCLKVGDTLARYSGDEFVAILPQIRDPGEAAIVAQRLLDALGTAFGFGDHELHISCSIGISIFSDDGTSIPDLLRNADAAMYRAKKRGRKRIEYYSPELAVLARSQVRLHNLLRRAIDADELLLHYQPQFDMTNRRLCGIEALARWYHDGQWISPAEFIPAAEESGLIVELGNMLLRRAVRQIAHWRQSGLNVPKVGINISMRQFEQNDFPTILTNILAECDISPHEIELEVTETVFAQDAHSVQQTIRAVRELGFDVAIDDFGTGYSSLSYLKALSISKLKIDQSFVRDLPTDGSDVAIVEAIISMAAALGIAVIAEGVENEAQFAFLLASGCQQAQGYLLGRPMPPEKIASLMVADPVT